MTGSLVAIVVLVGIQGPVICMCVESPAPLLLSALIFTMQRIQKVKLETGLYYRCILCNSISLVLTCYSYIDNRMKLFIPQHLYIRIFE